MNETSAASTPSGLTLGTWRLFLALLVVHGHLHDDWWAASFAVFSFYVISGYLVTLMMNRRYRYTARGIRAFFANRALRIYPPYYLAVALSLLVLALVPISYVNGLNPSLKLPTTFAGILTNGIIVGLGFEQPARLVPPAWALHVELCFYAAIGLFLGRGPWLAAAWFAASAAWAWSVPAASFSKTYFTLAAASLPFAAGACVFHLGSRIERGWQALPRHAPPVLGVFVYLLPFAAVIQWSANPMRTAFYANIAATAFLLAVLARTEVRSPRLRSLDRFFGDLSYPIYLFHWQTGILAAYALGLGKGTWAAFLGGAVPAVALAIAETRWLARPLESMRTRIRMRASGQS